MGFIRLLCRHYKQCGNEASWYDTNNFRVWWCDECKAIEEKAERADKLIDLIQDNRK